LIGPTALLLNDRKQACTEAMFQVQQDGDPAYQTWMLPAPVRLEGNWASVISLWSLRPNFYHWMLECLPRLALLDRFPPDTRIMVPDHASPYQQATLRWLGLEQRVHPLREKHLVVENFYFSAPTAMTGCANPYAVHFLRERFLACADANYTGPRKIYIRRRGTTRGILNEDELIAFLERRGWVAVDLEALTLSQQIKLFAEARAVCGAHGAGFTNLLWCQSGCIAIELCADNFLNGCYESLAESVGVEHRFLIHKADAASRFHVELQAVSKLLPT
jgi:capsular polysaccharide biosynthesis protein